MAFNRYGAVSLGMTFLIFMVIAFVVLIILSSATRNFLIGGLNNFGSLLKQVTGGGGGISGTAESSFTAYMCTTGCQTFPAGDQNLWYIDYNGQNSSANVTSPITFSMPYGNFSYTIYNINDSGTILCSNKTEGVTISGKPIYAGYAEAGTSNIIYFSHQWCT